MDEPNLPDAPYFPKRWLFALGGLAFGIFLGLAMIALVEYRDTAIRSEKDIYAFLKLPTLAVISQTGSSPMPPPYKSGKERKLTARKLAAEGGTNG
jgi:capsular polysaccharide biosynthesis protein